MILIRHGQTLFNLHYGATRTDPGIVDPDLTAEGVRQAAAAAEALAGEPIERLIASPYTRALRTAEIIGRALGLAVTVDTRVRERKAFSCDIGSPRSALASAWQSLDFGAIEEIWWPEGEEAPAEFSARCLAFGAEAAARRDFPRTAVVTHWGVVQALTGQRIGNGELVRFEPNRDGSAAAATGGCAPADSVLATRRADRER